MFSCHHEKRFEKHPANFLSQLIISVKTTLGYRCWGNINLSIVFHGSSVNIETMPINVCRLKQTTQTSKFKQRWWTLTINVVSTLIWCWVCWVCWVFFTFHYKCCTTSLVIWFYTRSSPALFYILSLDI